MVLKSNDFFSPGICFPYYKLKLCLNKKRECAYNWQIQQCQSIYEYAALYVQSYSDIFENGDCFSFFIMLEIMLEVVYDVSHHRIRKPPFSSAHALENEKLAFSKISTRESVFPPDTCERQVKPKKILRFQTKADTCGRGLHVIDMNKTKNFNSYYISSEKVVFSLLKTQIYVVTLAGPGPVGQSSIFTGCSAGS